LRNILITVLILRLKIILIILFKNLLSGYKKYN
jgi:hypothetical protein